MNAIDLFSKEIAIPEIDQEKLKNILHKIKNEDYCKLLDIKFLVDFVLMT